MTLEEVFVRCNEILAELEGLQSMRDAFRDIVQDSSLSSSEEDAMIGTFEQEANSLEASFKDILVVYIALIKPLT